MKKYGLVNTSNTVPTLTTLGLARAAPKSGFIAATLEIIFQTIACAIGVAKLDIILYTRRGRHDLDHRRIDAYILLLAILGRKK
jgi:hypothetical protein